MICVNEPECRCPAGLPLNKYPETCSLKPLWITSAAEEPVEAAPPEEAAADEPAPPVVEEGKIWRSSSDVTFFCCCCIPLDQRAALHLPHIRVGSIQNSVWHRFHLLSVRLLKVQPRSTIPGALTGNVQILVQFTLGYRLNNLRKPLFPWQLVCCHVSQSKAAQQTLFSVRFCS